VPELAEAAARTGDRALLESCLAWIRERTRSNPTDWSLGVEARIHAMWSEGANADTDYRRAIEYLERTPIATELARTRLLYGEWLRRQQRRVDAREQLGRAHDMFEAMGLEAFAERARRELAATRATARRRVAETRDDLTAQERQIAELARDGVQSRDRGTVVPQRADRRVASEQGLHQARDRLTQRTRAGAPARSPPTRGRSQVGAAHG
jgi:hypothetical protein